MANGLDSRSLHLRRLCATALFGGDRGHLGSTFSLVEIMRCLFDTLPMESWDNIVLSKGHGCVALYALLADNGVITEEDLVSFCRSGSILGGHPDSRKIPLVRFSTGSLGHGVGYATGLALSNAISGVSEPIYCIVGDGEMGEGSFWEALLSVSKHSLSDLVIIADRNMIQSAGRTADVLPLKDLKLKLESFGFFTVCVDGHDTAAMMRCLKDFKSRNSPCFLIAETVKGKGVDFAENNPDWHHQTKYSQEVKDEILRQLQ